MFTEACDPRGLHISISSVYKMIGKAVGFIEKKKGWSLKRLPSVMSYENPSLQCCGSGVDHIKDSGIGQQLSKTLN